MSIQKDLKKEGIEVINKLDTLISNNIAKNVARRIVESFPDYNLSQEDLCNKFCKLNMYRARMPEGMAEANYFYKNTSIYFNEHIDYEDLDEFAIHECIHYLQERKDEKNNLLRMGLCTYKHNKPISLGLNEAAVQYMSSLIVGIDADFEKYYNITLYTPSPSYYPVECSLLNEIAYFTGTDVIFKSTLFSNDDFKNLIISMSSEKTYYKISFFIDKILKLEELIVNLNNKISLLEDGSTKIDAISLKISNLKEKISKYYFEAQNLIIKEFFDFEFSNITNLEQLENFRHKIYKFSNFIGSNNEYTFFDNYYIEMMNKLEHKCNILENGGTETALSRKSVNPLFAFFKKIFKNYKSNVNHINS